VTETAFDMTDLVCDPLSDFQVGSIQIDIVSNQRHSGSDSSNASGWMNGVRTKIWLPLWIFHLLSHSLKLSLADFCQIFSVRSCGRFFIKEERLSEFLRSFFCYRFCQGICLFYCSITDRNKRHYVHTAHKI